MTDPTTSLRGATTSGGRRSPGDVPREGDGVAHLHPGSFRDPSGFVFTRDGVVYRQVNRRFADEFDALHESGLYERLVADGLLLPHEEVDPDLAPAPDIAHRVLRPEQLPFVSYPYEWCPGQLRDAALATLRVQDLALDHGLTLRDASAYNIQFRRGRPVLIDSLSFEPGEPGKPWDAYAQFCSHFLAPLALQVKVDVRLRDLLRTNLDGVPLDLASDLLPFSTRLRPSLLTHVHLHGRMQRRYADRDDAADEAARSGRFSERAFRGLVDSLRGAVDRLTWEPGRTTWSNYYDEATHYSDAAMRDKERLVAEMLDSLAPATVWDLGANTGRFSALAAERDAFTVAFDVDPGVVEAGWRDDRRSVRVLPLVMDLTNASPGLGWAHTERDAMLDRGPADTVLALALVHHLAFSGNVPLDRFVAFLAAAGRTAIVEFVPRDDPKARHLIANREDVFSGHTREAFETAAARCFTIRRRESLADTGRTLYLLEGTPE